tara:strand:- start:169 stop:384 length:216 start_codon:yes stop_codon:yes gene_type:complete
MTSIRDRILKAVNQKKIDSLVEESKTFEYISTNTKNKIQKAVVERINSLSGNKSKSKKKGKKNENTASRRK